MLKFLLSGSMQEPQKKNSTQNARDGSNGQLGLPENSAGHGVGENQECASEQS
jgi:hypothetical protein